MATRYEVVQRGVADMRWQCATEAQAREILNRQEQSWQEAGYNIHRYGLDNSLVIASKSPLQGIPEMTREVWIQIVDYALFDRLA